MDNEQRALLDAYGSVCGIDPSLTGLSVCSLLRDMTPIFWAGSSLPAQGVEGRIRRYERLADQVVDELLRMRPRVLLIEGYAYGSKYRSEELAEFGGILRSRILGLVAGAVREINPARLKRFASGKGNARKPDVAAGLRRRYGQSFRTDDDADAYALARLAACYAGWDVPVDPVQKAVLEGIDATSTKIAKARRPVKNAKEPRLFS